jgi:uncharacterized protein YciI
MRFTAVALALLALLAASACSSHTEAAGERAFTLVYLKTGPKSGQLGEAENRTAFDGHFSNMAQLAQDHKLVVAGPFGDKRHEPLLRGLFVINSAKRAEATEWAGTDPATRAGVFVLEFHDFVTTAPLVAMLDSVLARDAKAVAEGRHPKPGDGAQAYVLLTSDKFDAAERELTPLLKGGGVFMLAKVDGSSAFALLDAKNVDEAQQKFAAVLDRIGDCKLDDWFATDQLAHMSEL